MIALSPGSLCDVCAEEYGPHNYPHSIPCGHVLCLNCCKNILEKTNPRSKPCCPFCRELFTADGIRIIRIDHTPVSSGWTTPRANGIHDVVVESDVEDTLSLGLRAREHAKRLESKVLRVALKKSSVEEVTALQKELQDWLSSKVKPVEQTSSLELSAALLRAILLNHLAHSEATKAAKNTEAQMQQRIEELEKSKGKLETELRNLRHEYSELAQECQNLRAELNKHVSPSSTPLPTTPAKSVASVASSAFTSPARPQSTIPSSTASDLRYRTTSPTSPTTYSHASQIHSPLAARVGATANPVHARSASVQLPTAGYRPITPAIRTNTMTPTSPVKPETKTRRQSVSTPSPLKMVRSTSSGSSSDEILIQKDSPRQREHERQRQKDVARVHLIQRWLPSLESSSPPTGRLASYLGGANITSTAPRSRTISTASANLHPPARYKTPLPVHSP